MVTSNPFEVRPPTENPVKMRHTTARGRAWLLSGDLIFINVAGIAIATLATNQPIQAPGFWAWLGAIHWPVTIIFVSAIATVLIGAPLISFLCLGWYARYDEFQNSLKNDALDAYLKRFWSKWLLQTIQFAERRRLQGPPTSSNTGRLNDFSKHWPELGDRLFANIYHEQYGLSAFVPPFLILLAVTYSIVAVSAWLCVQGDCASPSKAPGTLGLSAPLIVSAIAGAMMFVVSDAVLGIRRRALNVSDVYWYSLRLFLAIPLALVAGSGSSSGSDPHVVTAFAVMILPVDEIMKFVRRFASHNVGDFETDHDEPDELLNLNGVTKFVTTSLHAEGITSIEQLAAADPVTLSIRTGFPFRFTLRLGSQAIVHRHFGADVSKLLPIGLADVVPIYLLVQKLNGTSDPEKAAGVPASADLQPKTPRIDAPDVIVAAAAALLFAKSDPALSQEQAQAVVKMKFRQIAAEEYTLMLARITPLDPAL
ncbi:helix-hairpin-helix domain-containing protein [Burkholderia ambifaria]|uniref:helix-hairpin-helix domain-containing protein n=1 Tax=Burkholderia ambifaria TaxID=152480 RepID=UPI00158CCE5B|nr:helix-hairpin-helix domain-containing protein [Burkholderia ambifaria]